MRTRSGFARLLPLAVLTGLAVGAVALWASAAPVQAPQPERIYLLLHVYSDGGCSDVPAPVPAHGIIDENGRAWELANLLYRIVNGLDPRNAEPFGVDVRSELLLAGDFRSADFGGPLWSCRFDGADLAGASPTRGGLRWCDSLAGWLRPEGAGTAAGGAICLTFSSSKMSWF